MSKRFLRAGISLIGLGVAACLYAGYSLCESDNHTVARIADPGIRRIEIQGGDGRLTVAWGIAGGIGKGIILAHGNSSDRNSMLPRMRYFHSLGYSVLAPDMNAHGETLGKRKTFGILESGDIRNADRCLRRDYGAKWVAALGTSLGGASILKAESDGADFEAIIIESVFSDIRTAAKNRLEMRLGRLGDFVEPLLTAQLPIWLGLSRDSISPLAWAGKCRAPILILCGASDLRAKPWESLAILANVPSHRKTVKTFLGVAHVDLFEFDRAGYQREIERFLADIQADSTAVGAGAADTRPEPAYPG